MTNQSQVAGESLKKSLGSNQREPRIMRGVGIEGRVINIGEKKKLQGCRMPEAFPRDLSSDLMLRRHTIRITIWENEDEICPKGPKRLFILLSRCSLKTHQHCRNHTTLQDLDKYLENAGKR